MRDCAYAEYEGEVAHGHQKRHQPRLVETARLPYHGGEEEPERHDQLKRAAESLRQTGRWVGSGITRPAPRKRAPDVYLDRKSDQGQ